MTTNLDIFSDRVEDLKLLNFGAETVFTPDSFPEIPEVISSDKISFRIVQRFIPNGLKDYVMADLSKHDSQCLGLWILGAYFQRKYALYKLLIKRNDSKIKEVWIDFRFHKVFLKTERVQQSIWKSPLDMSLNKFVWFAEKVENLCVTKEFHSDQKISLNVSNSQEEWIDLEQFYARDILIGFGPFGGGILAAEFFLNLGLEVSDVNYEYISHDFYEGLADADSCNFRAEVYHQSPNPREDDEVVS